MELAGAPLGEDLLGDLGEHLHEAHELLDKPISLSYF